MTSSTGTLGRDQQVFVRPSSNLDMVGRHSDDGVVPPLGPQDMGCCEDPGRRQQGPRAKPAVLWHPGQILHAEQNLPGEEAGLSVASSYNPLHQRRQRARRAAAGWRTQQHMSLGSLWSPNSRSATYLADNWAAWFHVLN